MKVSIQTLGSLGDVMPFITTARKLLDLGVDASIMAPRDYTDTIRAYGLVPAEPPAFSLKDWNTKADLRGTLNGPFEFFRDWNTMVAPYVANILAHSLKAAEDADIILANSICAPARLAAEAHGIPYILNAHQPALSPTREIPSAMMWRRWQGKWMNRRGYLLVSAAQRLMDQALKPHRPALGLNPTRPDKGTNWHLGRPLARVTSVSPALIPARPTDWRRNDYLMPYPSLDVRTGDTLRPDLRSFILAGPAPIHVGLGSFESEADRKMLQRLFRAIGQAGLRAVISSGLADTLDEAFTQGHFVTDQVSHAELFPLCAGIIHHGGAGTLDTALRAGVPQLVLPQKLDQFWHAARLQDIGVTPQALGHRSSGDNMARALDMLLSPSLQSRAKALKPGLVAHDGGRMLADFTLAEIERFRRNARGSPRSQRHSGQ